MKKKTLLLFLLIILIPAVFLFGLFKKGNKPIQNNITAENTVLGTKENLLSEPTKGEQKMQETPIQVNQNKVYTAVLKTTSGDITIELNTQKTPVTAGNFITLSKKNFYDNTIFHRAISGFMIQGGDPLGNGTGGPGYKFNDEPFEGEYGRGTIAMANSGPNTNGSQFFIMHADYPLPKNYVIFGKVISGMDTVDKIANASVIDNGYGEMSKPVNPVKIESVEIIEK